MFNKNKKQKIRELESQIKQKKLNLIRNIMMKNRPSNTELQDEYNEIIKLMQRLNCKKNIWVG